MSKRLICNNGHVAPTSNYYKFQRHNAALAEQIQRKIRINRVSTVLRPTLITRQLTVSQTAFINLKAKNNGIIANIMADDSKLSPIPNNRQWTVSHIAWFRKFSPK